MKLCMHQQLDDSPPRQRKHQDQYQERSTIGIYNIVQSVHGSTRNLIHHITYNKMLHELADGSKNQGLKMNNSKTKVMVENDTPILCQQHSDQDR